VLLSRGFDERLLYPSDSQYHTQAYSPYALSMLPG